MRLVVTIAILLAGGFVGAGCFSPVGEPKTQADGGAGDAGPRPDGGLTECNINGVFYDDGELDPLNSCLVCNAAQSSSQWTDAPDGVICGPNLRCFGGVCAPGCELDGGYVGAGRTDPTGCRVCGIDGLWTQATDGKACSLGPINTATLFCFDGQCEPGCSINGGLQHIGDPNPTNSCQYCGVPSGSSWTTLQPGSSCANGGTCDVNGACESSFCTVNLNGAPKSFRNGASKPDDPSLCCNSLLTSDNWSPRLLLSQTLAIDSDSRDFAAGDFNGDGWMDLAVISGGASASLTIFMNQQGILQASQVSTIASSSVAIAAADLGGDGFDDVILGDAQAQTISVWTSQGNGTFSQPVDYPGGPISHGGIQCADFNGDSVPDVVSGAETVLYSQGRGNGAGLMPPTTINDQPGWQVRFAVGDLNGDHTPDVTLLGFMGSKGNIGAQLGSGNGGFTSKSTPANVDLSPNTLGDVAEGDFDGDGFRDLAITILAGTGGETDIGTFQGFGDGTFGPIRWAPPPPSPLSNIEGLAIGDLDGESNKVLFAVMVFDSNQSVWKLYEYDTINNLLMPLLQNAAVRWPLLVDFNNDKATDIVGAGDPDIANPTLAIYFNGCP